MKKLIIAFCILSTALSVKAEQSSEEIFLQSKGARADAQISQEQQKLDELRAELAQKKKTLSDMRSEIANVEQELLKTSGELSKYSQKLTESTAQLDAINTELASSKIQTQEVQSDIAEREQRLQQQAAVEAESKPDVFEEPIVIEEPVVIEETVEVENIPEGSPQETVEETVLADTNDEIEAQAKNTKKDGGLTGSAKKGGGYVKDETTKVVKGAAKSAVRKGIRGVLGL